MNEASNYAKILMSPGETRECFRGFANLVESWFIPVNLHKEVIIGASGCTTMLWYRHPNIKQKTGNPAILVLRGGIQHDTDITDTHYIRRMYNCMTDMDVFMLKRDEPFIDVQKDIDIIDDALAAINYMAKPRKIYVIGFSMGGIFLANYLLNGRDNADMYYIVSSPLDVHNLQRKIDSSPAFIVFFDMMLRSYGVSNMKELFEKFGHSFEDYVKVSGCIYEKLRTPDDNSWRKRLKIIYGKTDRLIRHNAYQQDLSPHITCIGLPFGSHCSTDITFLTARELRKDERLQDH